MGEYKWTSKFEHNSTLGNSSSKATWPETFRMRFSGMLSFVEMCSEVTSLHETESWMWDLIKMHWLYSSLIEWVTLKKVRQGVNLIINQFDLQLFRLRIDQVLGIPTQTTKLHSDMLIGLSFTQKVATFSKCRWSLNYHIFTCNHITWCGWCPHTWNSSLSLVPENI